MRENEPTNEKIDKPEAERGDNSSGSSVFDRRKFLKRSAGGTALTGGILSVPAVVLLEQTVSAGITGPSGTGDLIIKEIIDCSSSGQQCYKIKYEWDATETGIEDYLGTCRDGEIENALPLTSLTGIVPQDDDKDHTSKCLNGAPPTGFFRTAGDSGDVGEPCHEEGGSCQYQVT